MEPERSGRYTVTSKLYFAPHKTRQNQNWEGKRAREICVCVCVSQSDGWNQKCLLGHVEAFSYVSLLCLFVFASVRNGGKIHFFLLIIRCYYSGSDREQILQFCAKTALKLIRGMSRKNQWDKTKLQLISKTPSTYPISTDTTWNYIYCI